MTRAASQAGDADSFRTPGLNSSVKTSMNDRGVPYYWRQNESAWLIRYLILTVKSCQDSLNLNKREEFKIKCMDRQAGNNGYIPTCAYELYIHKPPRSWHN